MTVRGGLLSGGEQQMLTLARALGRKPRLLLADELSLGLAPLVVDRLLQAVRSAADEQRTAVIMVEQHAHKALNYTDHAIVMRRGRVGLDLTGEQARHPDRRGRAGLPDLRRRRRRRRRGRARAEQSSQPS